MVIAARIVAVLLGLGFYHLMGQRVKRESWFNDFTALSMLVVCLNIGMLTAKVGMRHLANFIQKKRK